MEQNKNCKKGCDLKGNRSHDNGGIDAIVDDAGKTVEVESMEYIVCEKAVNDPNIHEYKGTNLQVVKAINKSGGGVDATVTDADGKIVIETGQVVINKKSLSDNTVRSFKGTNKQILSQINQSMGNGVAIYENGGQITKGSTITYKGNEFEVIGASTGKLKAYLVKDKNGVESVIMDNQLHNDKYSEGGSIMEIKSTIHTGNKRVKAGELQIAYFKNSDFPYKNKKVSSSKDAYDICKDIFSKNTIELQESFYALYLNQRNEIIAYEEISKGGTAGTVIDNKIILSIALKVLASGIIIAHNHPSGNLNPSDSDINISKKLKSAATYMDISLLDSLIITNDGYYSLADEGQLYKYGGTVNGYGYEDLSQKESDVVYENGGEVEGKSLKDEVIYFFQKNNVDVDKLRFKYSKQSRFEKNRYKNPEEEVWVFLNDKKYTRRGKELETSFVLTRTEFESYKKAGKSGVDLLIYGNQLPLLKNQMQEHLQGGLSDNKTILDISKKHNVSLDFANEQLEKGILVELEHTDNRDIASEIALDHLSESINYYIELEKMEEKLNEKTQPKEQGQAKCSQIELIKMDKNYALGGTISDENIIVNHNTYQNGIEIKFNSVPSYDVISKLKARGFRWSGRKKLWYNKYTESLFEWAVQPYAISENKNIQVEQNADFEDEEQVLSLSNDEILLKQPQLKQIYDIVMNGALNFVQNAPPSSIEIKNRIFQYNESIKGFTHLPKGRKRPDKYSYGDIYRLCVLELLNYSIMMDIETALMSESGMKSDIGDLERIVKKHPYLTNAEGYNQKLSELQAIKEKAIAEYDMWNKWKATHLKKGQEVYAKDGNSIKQVILGKSYGDNLDESSSFGYGRLDPAIVSCIKVDGWMTSVYTFKLSNIYLENPQINLDAKNVIEFYGSPEAETVEVIEAETVEEKDESIVELQQTEDVQEETYYRLKYDDFGLTEGSIGLLVNRGEVVHKLLFGENQSGQKLISNIDIYSLEEVNNKVVKVKVGNSGYKFLEDGQIIEEITTDESPKEIEEEKPRISLELSDYENRYEINRAIERLLDEGRGDYSTDEKIFMMNYSGYGNLEKFGATGIGLKYEFFTPEKIVEKMWGLAVKYGYTNGDWLEPSVGNGRFIKKSPTPDKCWAYEINKYSALICQILYPNANIINAPFETTFIKNNSSVKSKIGDLKKYDLVIGNPPYGELQGKYFGMGEKDSTKAGNFAEYFITRGLDLLNKDGLLIYIVGAELKNGGKLFLQGGKTKCKELISQKAILLDAYRLPAGLFESTNVETEIIVLKRK